MNWQDDLERVPEIEPYLARLGLRREELGNDEPSLSRLVRAHLFSIPYENIDVYDLGQPISLEIGHLYEKIIVGNRGGYCFELNGLFMGLLRALDFDTTACSCRVMKGSETIRPIRHRGALVKIGGVRYYCDVGYGGVSFPGAVPLIAGERRTHNGLTFWMEPFGEGWWRFCRLVPSWERDKFPGREEICELLVGTYANIPEDYLPYNEFCYSSPRSPFRTQRRAHLRTEEGFFDLVNDRFTIRRGDVLETRRLISREEIQTVLRQYFSIDIAAEELK